MRFSSMCGRKYWWGVCSPVCVFPTGIGFTRRLAIERFLADWARADLGRSTWSQARKAGYSVRKIVVQVATQGRAECRNG